MAARSATGSTTASSPARRTSAGIRGEDLEDVDVIWYVRGRMAFAVGGRVDRDAGRHRPPAARADPARRPARPVPGRAPGARRARPPQARAVAAPARRRSRPGGWHLLKANHLRDVGHARAGRRWRTSSRSSGSTRAVERTGDQLVAVRRLTDPRAALPCRDTPRASVPLAERRVASPSRHGVPAHAGSRAVTDAPPRASTPSPPASGRTSSPLQPTTATMYGDDRYDDRLDDPGPQGAPRRGGSTERAAARGGGRRPTPACRRGPHHARHARIVGEPAAIEDDELAILRARGVDQINGPQTLLAQLCAVPARRHARAPRRLARPPPRVRAVHRRPHRRSSRRPAVRPDRRRGSSPSARSSSSSGILAIPIDQAVVPAMSKVAIDADRERVRDVVREVVYPGRPALPRGARRPYLAATREQPGLVSAPDGDALYRHAIRRWTTLDMEPADVHQVGLEELASIDEERRAIAGDAGFGDDLVALPALARRPTRRTRPATTEELVARCNEDIVRAGERRAEVVRAAAAGDLRGPPGRGVQGEGRAVRVLLPADARRRRAPGIYYVNTYDLPSRTFSKLASTTYHEAIPGHHFQIASRWSTRRSTCSAGSAPRSPAAPSSRAGACTPSASPTSSGLYRNEAERFGMLDAQAWRASRLIVDSGHARPRLVAPAVDRLAAQHRPVEDRRRHRDRPLHRVARPGAHLHDRHARDPPAAPRARGPRRRPRSTSAASTTS